MNSSQIRRAAPMLYGIVVVVMWLTVKGKIATIVSVVGAMLLGLMYVMLNDHGGEGGVRGRNRDRNRNRDGSRGP